MLVPRTTLPNETGLGVTPTDAMPVPVAGPRSYLVYFDLNKATLDDQARAVVKEAAGSVAKGQTAKRAIPLANPILTC